MEKPDSNLKRRKAMKKVLAVLTVLVLLVGCCTAETAAVSETEARKLEMKSYPWYFDEKENYRDGEEALQLWFTEGANDLPFVELSYWADLMVDMMTDGGKTPGYNLKLEYIPEEYTVVMTRENEFNAFFHFDEGTIVYDDYVGFTKPVGSFYADPSGIAFQDTPQETIPLTVTGSRDRYGKITVIDLAEYGIPMIVQDGKYLLPLQTVSALFLYPYQNGVYFNGKAVFIAPVSSMENPIDDLERELENGDLLTPEIQAELDAFDGPADKKEEYMLELVSNASEKGAEVVEKFVKKVQNGLYAVYMSAPSAPRSDALIQFGYGELCMELDCLYGLKESHDISAFDMFFQQTGLISKLYNADAQTADQGIAELVDYWFDDGHSAFISSSWMAEYSPDKMTGYSMQGYWKRARDARKARQDHPEASQPYLEVDDTAYITFDEFELVPSNNSRTWFPDYYRMAEEGALPMDTIGILIRAFQQITRENSPVKNVVLDLSCNGGGVAAAAVYTLCMFLGESQFSSHNTFTGTQITVTYKADLNLDHVFDEQDTLAGRGLNLYCLTSPASFSCGNLLPWAFKENGNVTLLGKVSGGGSCVVQPLTTAWGTSYQISGASRIAFQKNGSYYDVDRGVEPDHIIDSYEHFYDRKALTEYIHGLY